MKNDRSKKDSNKVNDQIRSTFVFLIDQNGVSLGKKHIKEALRLASEVGLDLVEVAFNEKESVPICKIIDYGKLRYEKTKSKGKKSSIQNKEIKIGVNIAEHDLNIKINQMKKFLAKGTIVKYSLQLKGREKGNKNLALELFYNSLTKFEECAEWDRPRVSDNNIHVILHPKKL